MKGFLHVRKRSKLRPVTAEVVSELEQERARIDRSIAGKTLLTEFEDAVRQRLPRLKHLILIEGRAAGTLSWQELLERGDAESARDSHWFEDALQEVTPDDLITLIYTSGTTGPPKGVMDSHRQMLWMAASGNARLPEAAPEDRHLSYLPLAHAFERFAGHWNAIVRRSQVYFCPDLQKVFQY